MGWFQPKFSPRRRERGFILVVVLLVSLLLALMAAAFSRSIRAYLSTVSSEVEMAKAEASADAGVQLAILDLTASRHDTSLVRRYPIDGGQVACAFDEESTLAVMLEDEAGKVSLNMAGDALLDALFEGMGAGRKEAETYRDRILDFRDGDDNPRPYGAERGDYRASRQGMPGGPKNFPFDAVEEIEQVLGIPASLIERMKPFLSAHSRLSGVDPEVASPQLMSLLSGASGDISPGTPMDDDQGFTNGALPRVFVARSDQRLYTVRAQIRRGSGVRFTREAIVELGTRDIYVVRRWRQASWAGRDVPSASDLPPC